MTSEEREILQRLSAKAQRMEPKSLPDNKGHILDTDVYSANMVLLKR
jgi:hypothetical protein